MAKKTRRSQAGGRRPRRKSSPAGAPTASADEIEYFTRLAYKKAGQSRHTQDSPILPDVFIHFGTRPGDPRTDLLLTPDWYKTPTQLADELKRWLGVVDKDGDTNEPDTEQDEFLVAYNQSVVAVRLTFEELVCCVLPMSWWWQNSLIALQGVDPAEAVRNPRLKATMRNELREGLMLDLADEGDIRQAPETSHWMIQRDLIWAARLFWAVRHSSPFPRETLSSGKKVKYIDAVTGYLLDELLPRTAKRQRELVAEGKPPPREPWVYSVNRNRSIDATMMYSVATTKADVAVRTFDVRGKGVRWAIIDTGIDARHTAFRKMKDDGRPYERPFGGNGDNKTRIKQTWDFSDIRRHLSKDQSRALTSETGRLIDWEKVAKTLQQKVFIEHKDGEYQTPVHGHGTHVAGILGADWRPDPEAADPLGPPPTKHTTQESLTGLCPEIEFYDLRVFKNGSGDEFAVISALQFVRSLNQRQDTLEIHGVNLSLAMHHEVANFACGRSPVCEECSRLVANGVVVVAAAGNDGRSLHTTTQNRIQEGYRTVSIADPGNAEAVITVGSTHRKQPHTYGVSYFSSRGPTGDGRPKPDLVAPGEKILSTLPGDRKGLQDGTSQAAPHISGAAALLMCRHTELIGCPARIKKILMDSATDLGREKHFQGAGLVDVMRAMQSI